MKDTINIPKELLYIINRQNLLRNLHRYHGQVADRVPIMMKTVFMGTTIDRNKSKKFVTKNLQIKSGLAFKCLL